jgi:membrane associated rhomboid family serine protease
MKLTKVKVPKYYGFSSIVIVCSVVLVLEMLLPGLMANFVATSNRLWLLPITLFTHMFMHAGFNHFFFNMFFTAGMAISYEKKVGSKKFIRDFVVCGFAAALFFIGMTAFFRWRGLIGSSGACSGIMALGLLTFRQDKVSETLAMLALIGLFLANLIPGIVDCLVPSGVAHMAHVGGILAGVVIYCFNKKEADHAKPSKR